MPASKKTKETKDNNLENRVITTEKLVIELTEKVKEISKLLNDTVEELNNNGAMTHKAASRLGIES